jgi:hypothetical protein
MKRPFEISVEQWLEGEDAAHSVEQTLAEISIRIGTQWATQVEDRRAKTVRTTIRASAGLLATWILSNWWRLRWEPYKGLGDRQPLDWELSHSLPSIGQGFAWPPLIFASDGADIHIQCDGLSRSDPEMLSPIRYLNSFADSVNAASFEGGVRAFVESVIERLDATRQRDTVLHQLWSETLIEQRNPEQLSIRKLEALLGLDPEQNEALVQSLMKRWRPRVGAAALEEIAAAGKTDDVQGVLDAAAQEETSIKTFARLPDPSGLRRRVSNHANVAIRPWEFGKKAAYLLREDWGVDTRPISTTVIAERLQIAPTALNEDHPKAPFSFAVKHEDESRMGFILARRHEYSRRFDVARLVGDRLFQDTGDKWVPATQSFTARQKFQRAFAAEFLCPSDELERRFKQTIQLDDIDDVVGEISEEFNVSPKLVINHLVNIGLVHASAIEAGWAFVENPG